MAIRPDTILISALEHSISRHEVTNIEKGDPTDQTIKKELQALVAKITSFHDAHIFQATLPHNIGNWGTGWATSFLWKTEEISQLNLLGIGARSHFLLWFWTLDWNLDRTVHIDRPTLHSSQHSAMQQSEKSVAVAASGSCSLSSLIIPRLWKLQSIVTLHIAVEAGAVAAAVSPVSVAIRTKRKEQKEAVHQTIEAATRRPPDAANLWKLGHAWPHRAFDDTP